MMENMTEQPHEPEDDQSPAASNGEPNTADPTPGTTARPSAPGARAEPGVTREPTPDPRSAISQPAKVMRLGMMIKQLLEEVKSSPLDDAARERLAAVHQRSLTELESGLSPELVEELRRIALPFSDDGTPPTDAELRIAQAQLVGWLEGLFHGIQTALVAQQMSVQNQLVEMRKALPPGAAAAQGPGQPLPPGGGELHTGTGQYL